MSDKKERSLDEIKQDYNNLCARAGHASYQIKVLSDDLELLHSQLKDLNLEAAAIAAKKPVEAAEAPALAAVPDADPASSVGGA
jgi:hypothetical protein